MSSTSNNTRTISSKPNRGTGRKASTSVSRIRRNKSKAHPLDLGAPVETTRRAPREPKVAQKVVLSENKALLNRMNEDPVIRAKVIKAINPTNDVEWRIVDVSADQRLVNVHYVETYSKDEDGKNEVLYIPGDPEKVPRGMVVDLEKSLLVAKGFPKEHRYVTKGLKPDENNQLYIEDHAQIKHHFDLNDTQNVKITPAFDGFVLRVFKHNGVVYHSTYKSLHASRSHKETDDSFLELYRKYGGPSDNFLFDEEAFSPYVYVFLVVAPSMVIATSQYLKTGYVVWLGTHKMYSDETFGSQSNFKVDFAAFETTLGRFNFKRDDTPKTVESIPNGGTFLLNDKSDESIYLRSDPITREVAGAPFVYIPPRINIKQANALLKYGYSLKPPSENSMDNTIDFNETDAWAKYDLKAIPSEQVYILVMDGDKIIGLIHVESIAYSYRKITRGPNYNLGYGFVDFLSTARELADKKDFEKLNNVISFPRIFSEEGFVKRISKGPQYHIPIFELDPEIIINPKTGEREERLKHYVFGPSVEMIEDEVYKAYVFAMPPNKQKEALSVLKNFKIDRNTIVQYLSGTLNDESILELTNNKGRTFDKFKSIVIKAKRTYKGFPDKDASDKHPHDNKTRKIKPKSQKYEEGKYKKALTDSLYQTDPIEIYRGARFIERLRTPE